MSEGGEVFVLDMGEPVKIIDLAKRMVHLSGLEVKADETSEGTIEIHHVGLRPGEKLYEELLIGADVVGTEHPLIMKAKEAELPWEILQDLLSNLEKACDHFDFEAVRTILHCSVAEYVPQCGIEDFVWLETNKSMAKEGQTSKLTLVN
jgi:FlaA1/EpsC-like NDP-sugar epimerase